MQRDDDTRIPNSDAELKALFDALPREAPTDPRAADRLVVRLKQEGFFANHGAVIPRAGVIPSPSVAGAPSRAGSARDLLFAVRWPIGIAAVLLLVSLGAWGGWTAGRRGSLEEMLERNDLTVADRVLLLQRAGSAYVTAAQSYASATARTDTTAIEVASRVLLGAAHAVARNHLDAGVAARLTNALQPTATPPKPTIWF
jgi:hypothetical protein